MPESVRQLPAAQKSGVSVGQTQLLFSQVVVTPLHT
jgi:hypothetical protein